MRGSRATPCRLIARRLEPIRASRRLSFCPTRELDGRRVDQRHSRPRVGSARRSGRQSRHWRRFSTLSASSRTPPATRCRSGYRVATRRSRTRRPATISRRFIASYLLVTVCLCSCSTRPGCGSASSSSSRGATLTSSVGAGASRRPCRRRAVPDGCRCLPRSSRRSPSSCRARIAFRSGVSSRDSAVMFPDRDRESVHGRRRACLLAARPPSPTDQLAPPDRRAVGADRRGRRPAQPCRHGEHVYARPDR